MFENFKTTLFIITPQPILKWNLTFAVVVECVC